MFPGLRSLDDAQEGLLRQIFSPFAVAQHSREEAEEGGTMPAQQELEGPCVTLLVCRQQLLVGAFLRHINARRRALI